jgi:hypothetical protein
MLFPTRFFSPRGLIVRAMVLGATFVLVQLLGLREYTCIFSGTSPTAGQPPGVFAATLGATYAVLYILTVVVAPIMAIAAGLLWTFGRLHNTGTRQARL